MGSSYDGLRGDGDGNRSQHIFDHFDAERQIAQPQSASAGRASNNFSFQKLGKHYIIGFLGFLKPPTWIYYRQNGEKRDASECKSGPFSIGLERPSAMDAPIYERAGQCYFLCLKKGQNQLAIAVPCFRPTKPRQVRKTIRRLGSLSEKKIYHKIGTKERMVESDAAIFERLKWACFGYLGTWKEWLPFYGVLYVEEVNFQFVGVVENDGTFPIRMTSLDATKIQEEVDEILAMEPDSIEVELGTPCTNDGWHSTRCQDMMEYQSKPCIVQQISAARHRQKRHSMLDLLTKCGRSPLEANGMRVLEGMAIDNCMYEAEGPDRVIGPVRHQPYDRTDELRGLYFTLGWQKDRLYHDLPRSVAWSYLGVVIVWLCVLLWAQPRGDWSTAFAFGQLIAACVSLLVLHARD